MKHLFNFLLVAFLVTTTACTEREFPKPTAEGKQTLGCKVDGKVFIAQHTSIFQNGEPADGDVIEDNNGKPFLRLSGTDHKMDQSPIITLLLDFDKMEQGVKYILQEPFVSVASAQYSYIDENQNYDFVDYDSNPNLYGEIVLTYLNKKEQIAAGTFAFDAVNDKGEKVTVRDGRFDIKFMCGTKYCYQD